jgi:heat shock protein HtpX
MPVRSHTAEANVMLATPHLSREGAIREQDMAPVFVSGMVVILAISEVMTSGTGTTSVSAITNRLLQVASRAAGFTDHEIRQLGARRLDRREVVLFFPALPLLCKQAGLATPPEIYVIPGSTPNAFAQGDASRSAILVTEGLLATLNDEEMAGVLAHEIGHILNADAQLLAVAAELNRLVAAATTTALLKMALHGRRAFKPGYEISLPLLWSLAAPILSHLLECALSRVREFDADRIASALLGQPFWLIDALKKLSRHAMMTQRTSASPPPYLLAMLLSTHPDERQRVDRLLAFGRAHHRVRA